MPAGGPRGGAGAGGRPASAAAGGRAGGGPGSGAWGCDIGVEARAAEDRLPAWGARRAALQPPCASRDSELDGLDEGQVITLGPAVKPPVITLGPAVPAVPPAEKYAKARDVVSWLGFDEAAGGGAGAGEAAGGPAGAAQPRLASALKTAPSGGRLQTRLGAAGQRKEATPERRRAEQASEQRRRAAAAAAAAVPALQLPPPPGLDFAAGALASYGAAPWRFPGGGQGQWPAPAGGGAAAAPAPEAMLQPEAAARAGKAAAAPREQLCLAAPRWSAAAAAGPGTARSDSPTQLRGRDWPAAQRLQEQGGAPRVQAWQSFRAASQQPAPKFEGHSVATPSASSTAGAACAVPGAAAPAGSPTVSSFASPSTSSFGLAAQRFSASSLVPAGHAACEQPAAGTGRQPIMRMQSLPTERASARQPWAEVVPFTAASARGSDQSLLQSCLVAPVVLPERHPQGQPLQSPPMGSQAAQLTARLSQQPLRGWQQQEMLQSPLRQAQSPVRQSSLPQALLLQPPAVQPQRAPSPPRPPQPQLRRAQTARGPVRGTVTELPPTRTVPVTASPASGTEFRREASPVPRSVSEVLSHPPAATPLADVGLSARSWDARSWGSRSWDLQTVAVSSPCESVAAASSGVATGRSGERAPTPTPPRSWWPLDTNAAADAAAGGPAPPAWAAPEKHRGTADCGEAEPKGFVQQLREPPGQQRAGKEVRAATPAGSPARSDSPAAGGGGGAGLVKFRAGAAPLEASVIAACTGTGPVPSSMPSFSEHSDAECWEKLHNQIQSLHQKVQTLAEKRVEAAERPGGQAQDLARRRSVRLPCSLQPERELHVAAESAGDLQRAEGGEAPGSPLSESKGAAPLRSPQRRVPPAKASESLIALREALARPPGGAARSRGGWESASPAGTAGGCSPADAGGFSGLPAEQPGSGGWAAVPQWQAWGEPGALPSRGPNSARPAEPQGSSCTSSSGGSDFRRGGRQPSVSGYASAVAPTEGRCLQAVPTATTQQPHAWQFGSPLLQQHLQVQQPQAPQHAVVRPLSAGAITRHSTGHTAMGASGYYPASGAAGAAAGFRQQAGRRSVPVPGSLGQQVASAPGPGPWPGTLQGSAGVPLGACLPLRQAGGVEGLQAFHASPARVAAGGAAAGPLLAAPQLPGARGGSRSVPYPARGAASR